MYYQVKFKWEMNTTDGKIKKVTEKVLVKAQTCSDAEEVVESIYQKESPGFNITQIKVSDIKKVHSVK